MTEKRDLEEPKVIAKPIAATSWMKSIGFSVALHQTIVLICTAVIMVITSYGIVASVTGHIDVVGATLVNVEIPSPAVSPITVKPVSILMVAALGLTFSGYELLKPKFLAFSETQISVMKLLAFLGIVLTGYEVLYNFTIWTASIASTSLLGVLNPDILINAFPNPKTPWNLVFATKLATTGFAIAIYTFYVFRQAEKKREQISV